MSGELGKGVSYPTSNLSKISEDTSVDRVGSVTSVQIDIDRRKSSIGPLKRELNFTELWGKHYWRQFTSVTPGKRSPIPLRFLLILPVCPASSVRILMRYCAAKENPNKSSDSNYCDAHLYNMCSILRRANV